MNIFKFIKKHKERKAREKHIKYVIEQTDFSHEFDGPPELDPNKKYLVQVPRIENGRTFIKSGYILGSLITSSKDLYELLPDVLPVEIHLNK